MSSSTTSPTARLISQVARRDALARSAPAVAVVLGVAILIGVGERLLGSFVAVRAEYIALAAAALVGAAVVLAARRKVSARTLAARVDRQFGLHETLSTAVGMDAATANGPVERALTRYANRLAASLDPRKMTPLQGRPAVAALSFLLVAVVLAGVVLLLPERARRPSSQAPNISQVETAIDSSQLEALAQLLTEDAERQDSDYLAAVAHSVEQLAEDLKQGRASDLVASDLEALLEHARAGYGSKAPDWLQESAGDVGNVLAQATAALQAEQQAREVRASTPAGDGSSLDMYDLARRRTETNAELAKANAPADTPTPDGAGGGDGAPSGSDDFAASPMQSQQLQQVGSFSAGGAAQSGKGESNAAGGGAQPLLDDSGFLQSMPDPTVDMALTAADPQQDGRIRLFVPTSAEASASTGMANAAADYARLAAQVVDRQAVDEDALPIVSRYFNNVPVEGGAP